MWSLMSTLQMSRLSKNQTEQDNRRKKSYVQQYSSLLRLMSIICEKSFSRSGMILFRSSSCQFCLENFWQCSIAMWLFWGQKYQRILPKQDKKMWNITVVWNHTQTFSSKINSTYPRYQRIFVEDLKVDTRCAVVQRSEKSQLCTSLPIKMETKICSCKLYF